MIRPILKLAEDERWLSGNALTIQYGTCVILLILILRQCGVAITGRLMDNWYCLLTITGWKSREKDRRSLVSSCSLSVHFQSFKRNESLIKRLKNGFPFVAIYGNICHLKWTSDNGKKFMKRFIVFSIQKCDNENVVTSFWLKCCMIWL